MKSFFSVCCLLLLAATGVPAEAQRRPMEVDDMFRMERLGEPAT